MNYHKSGTVELGDKIGTKNSQTNRREEYRAIYTIMDMEAHT